MPKTQPATLAILNANIITMNPAKPRAEAVATKNSRIIAVGTNSQIKGHVTENTKIIDAKGKTVIPGLIDTHVHMTALGFYLKELDLRDTDSIRQLQQKLKQYSEKLPQKKWIIGRGWDQEKFMEKRYPTRHDLDAVESQRPVLLIRVCGHLAIANTKALELAKINREKRDVFSEEIDLDYETGELTGILREKAIDLVWKTAPRPTMEEVEEACVLACKTAVQNGLTTVHCIVGSPREVKVLQKLRSQRKLPIRLYVIIPAEHLNYFVDHQLRTGYGDAHLKIGSCKVFTDGSLGARTALLDEPYADAPETRGIAMYTQKELNRLATKAHKVGFQLAVHAIGDKAIDMALKAFENLKREGIVEAQRHRIEHASVLNTKLIERVRKLGIIASVQPHFVISDFWITQRLGDSRARWTYPLKTLIEKGIMMTGGSDSPVEPINPILGVWAAVARKTFKEQRLSLEEALRLYTTNAAYASFEEDQKGSVETEKLADLVILSEDLEKVPKEKIRDIKVEMTIVDGSIVN